MTVSVDLAVVDGGGCDYCGVTTDLERYEAKRPLARGLRCVDADSCMERENALALAEEEEDE